MAFQSSGSLAFRLIRLTAGGLSVSARGDEDLTTNVRASFVGSVRTYGARRVWRDLLADGISCGLHKIERLMRVNALRARQ